MARQVYYDPFGMRLQGERMGREDEIGLQSATRQARLSDWQYNNELPLELRARQREDRFQQFYDPFRRNSAKVGDELLNAGWWDNERKRREMVAMTNGNFGMVQAQDQARYPVTTVPGQQHAVDSVANKAFDDWSAVLAQEGIDAADPIAIEYQAQFEDMYGLPRGSLMDPALQAGPQVYSGAPPMQIWQDPATGQVYQFATAPNAYEQRAWMPEAAKYADFGLRQNADTRANEYLRVQQMWQDIKARQGGATPASSNEALGYFSGD